jgi:hypothetical protein
VPDNIASLKTIKAQTNCLVNNGFAVGDNVVFFIGPLKDENENFFEGWDGDAYVAFQDAGGGNETSQYKVLSGGPTGAKYTTSAGDEAAYFELTLAEGIKAEDSWLGGLSNEALIKVILYKKETKVRAEFVGRFFAKVDASASLLDNISAAFGGGDRVLIEDRQLTLSPSATVVNDAFNVWLAQAPVANGLGFSIISADHDFADQSALFVTRKYIAWSRIITPGTKFKFKYSDGSTSQDLYTVNLVSTSADVTTTNPDITRKTRGIQMDRVFDDTQYNPGTVDITHFVIYKEQEIFNQEVLSSTNPAIFETEPDELADLDIYWEVGGLIDANNRPPSPYYIPWYNCYSFGNGVESDRIRDDFNAPIIGKGVRVNAELQEPYKQERRASGLIYGGLYNSLSSVNNTNQFIAGVKITKDLDPQYGGIQKLHTRDTNLVAFAEDKVFRILADKDALYNADGNTNITSTNRVLGDASTFAGEFGISKNPESFAQYGFRVYFTDKARGAVLRLSNDGITEISEKGMTDFFVDAFAANTTPVIGSFDESTSAYNIKLNNESVSYKERVDGWPTRLSFDPEFAVSLNNEYYTFKNGEIWEHSNETRNNFYGAQENSQVTVVFNDAPSSIKNFKTLSYEGTEKWTATIATDKQNGTVSTWRDNEGIYHNFIKGDLVIWDNVAQEGNIDSKEFSVQGIGVISTIQPIVPYLIQAGDTINTSLSVGDTVYIKREKQPPTVPKTFDILKVGDVVSISGSRIEFNDPSNIAPQVGEYAFFLKSNQINTSGLLGYYANVTFTNTDKGFAELFAINSEVFISSE